MADPLIEIHVRCDRYGGEWLCHVTVGDHPSTTHDVEVTDEDLSRFSPGVRVERLVEESFRFLLEREPREAILRRFALPVIERYFPEYATEVGRRLQDPT